MKEALAELVRLDDEAIGGLRIDGSAASELVVALSKARQVLTQPVAQGSEIAIITDMNHGQFLELEYLRPIFKAAHELYAKSEEYDFDDGMGRGAPQDLWDALADSFEPKTDAIAEVVSPAAPRREVVGAGGEHQCCKGIGPTS